MARFLLLVLMMLVLCCHVCVNVASCVDVASFGVTLDDVDVVV